MYPKLQPAARTRTAMTAFGGYAHVPLPAENQFYNMENLSSDLFPVLSPRPPRGTLLAEEGVSGLIGKDTLCYTQGDRLFVNGYPVEMGLTPAGPGEVKTLVSMGAYIVVFPDKKYVNTRDLTDFGAIDAVFAADEENEVIYRPMDQNGLALEDVPAAAAAPPEPAAGEYWIDTSTTPHRLKLWSDASGAWVTVESTAVRIEATGIGAPFRQGDGVKLSGIAFAPELEGYAVLKEAGEDYIVVTGLIDGLVRERGTLVVERRMPYVDFVTEAGNRLWACRYGTSREGTVVNEIYASKLGDFKNWHCFEGLSTDSYAASVGTDGAWTGAATHLGYPCFFKENVLHKVYAAANGAHAIRETPLHGVKRGAERSLATVGQTLFYLSQAGVMAYDGALPVPVSAALGALRPENAAAGAWRDKYYLSGEADGAWHLLVYDTAHAVWHREDATHALAFAAARGELYFLTEQGIRAVHAAAGETPERVSWMAETGPIGITTPDAGTLERLSLSLELARGAILHVEAAYDGETCWQPVASITADRLRSVTLPIRPRRAHHLRLRLSGEGDVRLFSLTRVMEEGSDR